MSPVHFYRRYVKNNMFTKMLLLFVVIAVTTIVTLSYLMFRMLSQSVIQNELSSQREAVERVERYVHQKYVSIQSYVNDLYRSPSLGQDTSYFLLNSFEDYIAKRIDRMDAYPGGSPESVLDYFKKSLEDDPEIQNLMLYSAEKQYVYVYTQGGMTKLFQANQSRSYIPDVMALETPSVSVPNEWVRKLTDDQDTPLYSVRTPINDMRTYKNLGQLLVYFKSHGLDQVLHSAAPEMKGYVLILNADGQVMYDSSGRYYGERYPYAQKLLNSEQTVDLEQASYTVTLSNNQGGFTVVGVAPKAEIAAGYRGIRNTIILLSALCIIIAVSLPGLLIVSYSKRTNNIIRFMRKVETGDFVARIQDPKEDQLGQISKSFNEMLDELTRYIDKVYLAEINEKKAELSSLQARINPHFLYNTLEVIRMRALSHGARDVGDMIYSLSVLFKNMVQRKEHYTLKDELEACRLYLELFRIRYKDKFIYKINWDPALKDLSMIKMSLQPLIENYIVHGLRADGDDNIIDITVTREEQDMFITVQDNGKGMSQDVLESVRRRLLSAESDRESFGLRSVSERLRLTYGPEYGMGIESSQEQGTTVTLKIPVIDEELRQHV
ncbi:cache domain-containing sensor histidine kinase [Paenibacillus lemnae]|uniref:histidine kinase n=1 Tax=Paenibacillus lemnae TaxID=1330551 RepID=A0A848M392_PAELE|nr:sensor histidine kinase [Paenibacillus lemnae]NMO94729.1 sensor histidine kinase [Paenibacillus lemnae]